MASKTFNNVTLNVKFTQAADHNTNILSNDGTGTETLATAFGKISKWYADFDPIVWDGNAKTVNGVTVPENPVFTDTVTTVSTGSTNGTISVKVGSNAATNVAVKGLGSAAYTASTAYAKATHSHTVSEITDLLTTSGDDVGKIRSDLLPSYVDDVLEGYYDKTSGKFYKESAHTAEITGEVGKIYVDLTTNDSYRWSGSTWVKISSPLSVSVTQTIKAGNEIGKIIIDGVATPLYYTPGLSDITPASTSVIGGIKIDGVTTTMNSSNVLQIATMTGAKSSAAGKKGLVPAPATGDAARYLRGDGTWATPTNTDTKVNVTLNTTAKAYLLGTTTTPTSTAAATTAIADTGVYLDTTAGKLVATSFKGNGAELTNVKATSISDTAVTAGSYGPTADATLTYGGTFTVPNFTVSKEGRLTAAGTQTMTMPAQYTHPAYTAKTNGLYKITVDALGHVSATAAVVAKDITDLGIKGTDTTYTLSGALSGNTFVSTLTPSSGDTSTSTVPAMSAATSSAAGKAGLVPAPGSGKQTAFLRGDGTWVVPTNTWIALKGATASADGTAGYAPKPTTAGWTEYTTVNNQFLCGDGTWSSAPVIANDTLILNCV